MQDERTIAQTISQRRRIEGTADPGLFPIADRLRTQILIVPGERVHLGAVDLPIRNRKQRLSALPFALEESLAQPLSEVHIALGPSLGETSYVAGAVDTRLMADWVTCADMDGQSGCAIVPETALLPIPSAGRLSHLRVDGRNIVRSSNGSGFVSTDDQFPALWEALGRPALDLFGENPRDVDTRTERASVNAEPVADLRTVLDLRQGAFAHRAAGSAQLKIAAALALGVLSAHTAIAGFDALAINHATSARETLLVEEFRARFPDTPPGTELTGAIERMMTTGSRPDNTFLHLLSDVSAAVPADFGLSVNQMKFDTANGQLSISAEAAAMKALEDAGLALRSAGLAAELGATRMIDGGAEGNLVVNGKGGG